MGGSFYGELAEQADAADLKSAGYIRVSSSLTIRIII